MTKPQPNMPIYIDFIAKVIESCRTLHQLINAKNWAHNYCKKNNVQNAYWNILHKKYQQTRRGII